MNPLFHFDYAQFNRLFPFFILVNRALQIVAMGQSLRKIYTIEEGDSFPVHFSIPRPFTPIQSFQDLFLLENQLIVLEDCSEKKLKLRGQIEFLPKDETFLFIGSPWFGSMEEVMEHNLILSDFAHHDPLIDLLHVLKSQDIVNQDLKNLISTINKQKADLKRVNKEIQEIALFPTQNPDPLIRISFKGELIRNNPAAATLDSFEFENQTLRNNEFFKIIAERIDKTVSRWIIEATSGNRIYSFICLAHSEEQYINIYGRDITQNKKVENEIIRLSLVASANKNGVLFTDQSGNISWANEGFCKLTGYSLGEILGKSPVDLCRGPLTDEAKLYEILESFYTGKGFSADIIFYKKDGSWFWGNAQSQPIKNRDGTIKEFFGIIQDITHEKETEEKLKVLSQIAEDNINAVIIADETGRIRWANKSFATMTGYSVEEAIGKKPGELLQGPETNMETVKYLANQIADGEPFNTEILNYKKNGKKYWLRIQGQPIKNEKGIITGYFAVEEDITKELESEKRFRKVLENIGDNIWEHDFRTGKTVFSSKKTSLLGYEMNSNDNLQLEWWNSVHPEDMHLLSETDKKYKSGKIDNHSLEYRIIDKFGNEKWVLDRGIVIDKNKMGLPNRVIGTHIDISRQKTLENELKTAKENAEASTRAKESFLANMSHEIRTPMNAIMGMSYQLAKTSLSEKQKFFLQAISSSSENLLVIINDILDLSKIEAGKLSLEQIGFEPKSVMAHIMQVLNHKAEEKGLVLSNSFCDTTLSNVLIGDPYRLNQILLNLMGNAIKFTEKGSVDVRCDVEENQSAYQIIKVSVSDTGIGIDEEYIGKLFDKFSQEYSSISRRYGGTGLGLSIVKDLIDLMDGTIEVQSKKGLGTTITFSIKFAKGTPDDLPKSTKTVMNKDFLIGRKILIADDNDMNRLVASTMLKNYGVHIFEACDGQEARDIFVLQKPDLVLMDIQMPVKNGYEASKDIRALGYDTPIIALTANALRGENENCLANGMNDFLAKPFREEDLLEIIAHWIAPDTSSAVNKNVIIEDMNDASAEELLFDLTGLKMIAQGNNDFIIKMLSLFIQQAPSSINEIKSAWKNNDIEKVRKIAHRLKPSIDNLGIGSIKNEIRLIERFQPDAENPVPLDDLIATVDHTISLVVQQFSTYLSHEGT